MKTVRQHLRGRVKAWIARRVGVSYGRFLDWIRNNAVPQNRVEALAIILGVHPSEIPVSIVPGRADPKRTDEWERRYRAGATLAEIGKAFGVTRERVRQLLAKRGVTRLDGGSTERSRQLGRRIAAERDARYIAKYGMPFKAYRAVPPLARARYKEQRRNAQHRRIEWHFTLASWWGVWLASGRWEQRGRTRGAWVMSRIGDTGPYSPGNCRLVPAQANIQEYYDRERAIYGHVRSGQERKAA